MSINVTTMAAVQAARLAGRVVSNSIEATKALAETGGDASQTFSQWLQSATSGGESVTPEKTLDSEELLASVTASMRSLLDKLGIGDTESLTFELGSDDQVRLAEDHPAASAIEHETLDDPALHHNLLNWLRNQPNRQGTVSLQSDRLPASEHHPTLGLTIPAKPSN